MFVHLIVFSHSFIILNPHKKAKSFTAKTLLNPAETSDQFIWSAWLFFAHARQHYNKNVLFVSQILTLDTPDNTPYDESR